MVGRQRRAPGRASRPRSRASGPGTSISRSMLTDAMPARRAAATASRDIGRVRCRRPSRRSSPGCRLWAPEAQPRDARGAETRPGHPARSAPGWPRGSTSASGAMPNRRSTWSSSPATWSGRQQRRRAAAEVHAGERRPGRRTPRPARPRAGPARRAAPRRAPGSGWSGPAASRPVTTTKSQYGHSETQNGMCRYSPTGGRGTSGVRSSRSARSVAGAGRVEPRWPPPWASP